jgi:Domain of unknown function (DUF4375)
MDSDEERKPVEEQVWVNEALEKIRRRWGSIADDLGVHALPATAGTILTAVSIDGIVKNGGFAYLLGSSPPDRDLKFGIAAFRRIGCERCADILSELLSSLRTIAVSRSPEGRYKKYLTMPLEWRGSLDREFWDAAEDLETRLAEYIRQNQDTIEKELALPKGWLAPDALEDVSDV